MLNPSPALLESVRRAFHANGFAALTMEEMAGECSLTRRSLYNYFHSKGDAFRVYIDYNNGRAIKLGFEAGASVKAEGGDAVDIMTAIMNVRYGDTRRSVETSPHLVELNAVAFSLCRDIMITYASRFHEELGALIVALGDEGYLKLRDDFPPEAVAQALANGARGVNQTLPPAPLETLEQRYRDMCRAVLFGAVGPAGDTTKRKPRRRPPAA